MSEISGYDICMQLRASEETRAIPIVFLTAISDIEAELSCISLGAIDFVSKTIDTRLLNAKIKNYIEIKNERNLLYSLLAREREGIDSYADALLGEYLKNFSDSLAIRRLEYAREFTKKLIANTRLSFSADFAKAVCAASVYHDSDKSILPDEIIGSQAGRLFDEAASSMSKHLRERWDGTGYPDGLKGIEIPLPARIMAIIDFYDLFMRSTTHTEQAYHFEAVRSISAESGKSLDPELTLEFLSMQDRFLHVFRKNMSYEVENVSG
jgi:putative two-component system response regulator